MSSVRSIPNMALSRRSVTCRFNTVSEVEHTDLGITSTVEAVDDFELTGNKNI
jgi:hypothetical protein